MVNQIKKSYKAMYKYELADAAGVKEKVLASWLKLHEENLKKMGIGKKTKLPHPAAVRYVCETFDIEV